MTTTPKFSPSLYGPFYKNRPELAEDRYNVNYNTNRDPPPSVGYNTNRSEESRFTFDTSPEQTGRRSTSKNSSSPKFSPSLYGPFYKNREHLAEDRYNKTPTASNNNVIEYSTGGRNMSESRASRNGTSTTHYSDTATPRGRSVTRRIETDPGGTVRTTTTKDGTDWGKVFNVGLYGPYYKNRPEKAVDRYNLSPRGNERIEMNNNEGEMTRVVYDRNPSHYSNPSYGTRRTTTTSTNKTLRPRIETSNSIDVRDLNINAPYVGTGGHESVVTTNSHQNYTTTNGIRKPAGYIDVDPSKGEVVKTTVHTEPDGTRVETQTIKHVIQHLAGVDLGATSANTNTKTSRRVVTEQNRGYGGGGGTTRRSQRNITRHLTDPDGEVVNTTIHTEPDGTRVETKTLKHVIQHVAGLDVGEGVHSNARTTTTRRTMQQPAVERKVVTQQHINKPILKNPEGEVVKTTIHTEPDGTRIETQTIKHVVQHMSGLKFDESSDQSSLTTDENGFRYQRTLNSTDVIKKSSLRRRSPQHGETLQRIPESGSIEQYSVSRRDRPAAAHDNWPIYKYQGANGVSVMVRTTPGKINEVKNHLCLTDGLSPDRLALMPALPASEFDADEEVSLSPMQLAWTTTPAPKVKPIYIIMPINALLYNESLQQLVFVYSVDNKEWQHAEGRIIQVPVNGQLADFYEVVIPQAFESIIFDIKMRYFEDTRDIGGEGGEIHSSLEPGVKVIVHKRTFDDDAKVKLRVEPFDMNETNLNQLIPGVDSINAIAVSPVVKITASEPTKRPIIVCIPKPGQTLYGSTKMGLKNKVAECRGQHVVLYTKDRQVSKYQQDGSLHRESPNEYLFNVRIWKSGGSCYAFVVMNGQDATLNVIGAEPEEKEFLNRMVLEDVANAAGQEELKVRSLGRILLNYSATNEIFRNYERDPVPALTQILKRWKGNSKKVEEGAMVRQLVVALREVGYPAEAANLQARYRKFLLEQEGNYVLEIFDELKSSPAVMVNWHLLGRVLGLSDAHLKRLQEATPDLRKRCYTALRIAFERLKNEEEFYREIVLRYIAALRKIGCPNIAESVERRHLPKFYVNGIDK